ncbi:GNAT family N-acetyltransferase [Dermabacter vaginalis]|uniref:GNAT family N-acetyltransferase n=1 Tax=Dermabacter TaxID=36739 RepID=UPI000929546A|nr:MULTISPECIES: GNAT family protein [Dermabacter]MCT2150373.1 GNAT family N-acetyltransferase [Dermabacter vaginalis]SHX06490.1 acetyltransferase, ribosomal protein N-acetylase [Mycobacteroides abscessus subsp. abscessus]
MPTSPLRLAGDFVVLEPLSLDHLEGLKDAVSDGELWKLWYANIAKPAEMRQDIERRLTLRDEGSMIPYTVIRKVDDDAGYIAGLTCILNIDRANRVAEIGATWYARSVQGTAVNPEAKFLLLRHLFEVEKFQRIELRTHALNRHSRAAIEKLGATFEGIMRRHRVLKNGTTRDTALYSILDYEWPTVRAHLEHRLAQARA